MLLCWVCVKLSVKLCVELSVELSVKLSVKFLCAESLCSVDTLFMHSWSSHMLSVCWVVARFVLR